MKQTTRDAVLGTIPLPAGALARVTERIRVIADVQRVTRLIQR